MVNAVGSFFDRFLFLRGECQTMRSPKIKKSQEQDVFSAPSFPRWFLFAAFGAAFTLPNLLYSGVLFFDTLHFIKWIAVFCPLAVMGVAVGFNALRGGASAKSFAPDSFALVWLALLLYITAQPLWIDIRSMTTFYREWFFFASLWLLYVLSTHLVDGRLLRILLWGALLNAVISVFFAELQIRGANIPYSFILPTPGHYIANTGQQNMFALWMAVCATGGVFLLMITERRFFIEGVLWVLLAVVFWGLWASTSRSGIFAFILSFVTLSAFFLRNGGGKKHLPKIACVLLVFLLLLGAQLYVKSGNDQGSPLLSKMTEIVKEPASIAKRDSIWATAWTMFSERPVTGVGLGQFKWNYLFAQREMLHRWPHLKWQFTLWAHNEFLQWFAEGGLVGGVLLIFLWLWWGCSAVRAFIRKTPLPPETFWGSALAALFVFNALWTRPFHRIENTVWLALAFAVTNRNLLYPLIPTPSPKQCEKIGRLLGGVACLFSLLGLLYLGDGIRGDRLLLAAAQVEGKPAVQKAYMEQAFSSFMVRDLAEKRLAYFSVYKGEYERDKELLAQGLNALMDYFEKQPHTEELAFLREWALTINHQGLKNFISFFTSTPGIPTVESMRESLSAERE